jgi:hypothetical protein
MPQQVVEVPGVGDVEFPDTMTDDEIAKAIRTTYPHLDKGVSLAPPPEPPLPYVLQGIIGAGKGLAATAYELGRLPAIPAARAWAHASGKPEPPWIAPVPESLRPGTTHEKIGYGLEHAAEYMVPSAWEAKAVQILPKLPLIARAAYGALSSMGVGALQGADPEELALIGFLGGLPAGSDWVKATLGEKLPPRVINSLIRPMMRAFAFAKNPGRGVAEEGIVATSMEDLTQKIYAARERVGREISAMFRTGPSVRFDVRNDLVKPLQDAMDEAGRQNKQPVYNKLKEILQRFTEDMAADPATGQIVSRGPRNLTNLTPDEVFEIKKAISKEVNWIPESMMFMDPSGTTKLTNKPLTKIYGNLQRLLNRQYGSRMEALNERYADLNGAWKAVNRQEALQQKLRMLGVPSLIMGGLAGAEYGTGAGAGVFLGRELMGTVLAKTLGAQLMRASGHAAPDVLKLLPALAQPPPPVPGATTATQAPPVQAQAPLVQARPPAQAPTGKVVIRRPGQKQEQIVDAYIDDQGKIRLVSR